MSGTGRGQERDSAIETRAHIAEVQQLLETFALQLVLRGHHHDRSKLGPKEKPHFDRAPPLRREVDLTSPEYMTALRQLGQALEHHYKVNSHHPEHYPNGVAGMCLVDLLEMVCDWKVTSQSRGRSLGLDYAFARFPVEPQLQSIIRNTAQRAGWG
jgi:hypothetical protein